MAEFSLHFEHLKSFSSLRTAFVHLLYSMYTTPTTQCNVETNYFKEAELITSHAKQGKVIRKEIDIQTVDGKNIVSKQHGRAHWQPAAVWINWKFFIIRTKWKKFISGRISHSSVSIRFHLCGDDPFLICSGRSTLFFFRSHNTQHTLTYDEKFSAKNNQKTNHNKKTIPLYTIFVFCICWLNHWLKSNALLYSQTIADATFQWIRHAY